MGRQRGYVASLQREGVLPPAPEKMAWTAEHDAELARRYQRGDRVDLLAAEWGISKSAVVGRAHRRGFVHAATLAAAERKRGAAPARPGTAAAPPSSAPHPSVNPARLPGPGECCWPTWGWGADKDVCPGHPDYGVFCCQAVRGDGEPYCDIHCARAYVPGRSRDPEDVRKRGLPQDLARGGSAARTRAGAA